MMVLTDLRQHVYEQFAGLLEYPRPDLAAQAAACARLLRPSPEAAGEMLAFHEMIADTPTEILEEIYTGAFDLNPTCCIYVGFQLFGEDYRRGAFLVGLKQRYREVGLETGNELADHLPLVFRYLALVDPESEAVRDLLSEIVIPALHRMVNSFAAQANDRDNPYAHALRSALYLFEPAAGQIKREEAPS